MLAGPALLALLLAAPLQLAPGDSARVAFVAHGPVGMKIEGSSTSLSVGGDDETIVFTLPLASLQTGIELRDKHMREALQDESFPTATLRVKRAALSLPAFGAEGDLEVPGELTLHGQTSALPLHAHLKRGAALEVSAGFQLDMTQFGLQPPSYLGVKVKPQVELTVAIRLQEAAPMAPAVPGGAR